MHKTRRILRRLRRKLRRARERHRHRAAVFLARLTKRYRKRLERIRLSHREGVDFSYGRPDPEALLDAGKTFVGRYLTHTSGMKLSRAEADKYHAAGIDIISVWEDGFDAAKDGEKRGFKDGVAACEQARHLDQPRGTAIFFAVDFEAAGPDVQAYFEGARHACREYGYALGAYGSKTVVGHLFDEDLIDYGFQTYAWSHHEWDPRAHVKQVLINLPEEELEVGGAAVDYCRSTALDFGQW